MRSLNRGSGAACGGRTRVGSFVSCKMYCMCYTKLVHTVVSIWLKPICRQPISALIYPVMCCILHDPLTNTNETKIDFVV